MKKIMLFAAAVAALVACTKEQGYNESSFKEGQIVTLNVTADVSATKVTSELNATSGKVSFKWEAGDKILVTVSGKSAEFTLKSGAGEASATFTGTMPADGETFSVQYPVTDPTLTTQAYSSTEAIPHDMMKFAATGCSTSSPTFTLAPQYAVLRLNLYGGARSVSQIAVTNTSTSATYTLTCSPAKVVGKDKDSATPFFIVVPVGTGSWNFSAAVTAAEVTSTSDNTASYESYGLGTVFSLASTTFTPAKPQKITAGGILNMPAKSLTTVWAPVNCGYDATHTYGLLYQWGRKDGCGYNDGSTYTETLIQTTSSTTSPILSTAEGATVFYKISDFPYDWLTSKDDVRWNSGSESSPVKVTSNDPCPTGWRVPTNTELTALFGKNSSPSLVKANGQRGCYFNGTSSATSGVFLPAAGCRDFEAGSVRDRGNYGFYWSSSVNGDYAKYLQFYGSYAIVYYNFRAYGFSVRCVQE